MERFYDVMAVSVVVLPLALDRVQSHDTVHFLIKAAHAAAKNL